MNCTTVEKLLPLYVEGDASKREAEAVRAHLSSCETCRRVEEEFAASQVRLHNFAVPEFGAEFYEQIRGAVLKEISSSPAAVTRPSLFETLRAGFQWRTATAFSLALLIMAGALSFALYRSLGRSDRALLAIDKSMGDLSPLRGVEEVRTGDDSNSVSVRDSGFTTTARNGLRKLVRSSQPAARPESSNAQSIESAASSVAEARQTTVAVSERASTAPVQAVARMEIQTSDPNIRIIWLAPKSGE